MTICYSLHIYDYKVVWATCGLMEGGMAVKKGGDGLEDRRQRLLVCGGVY